MARVNVKELLKLADEKDTAVMAFNCNDYTMAYSVVKVAEELQKPCIIMLYPADNRKTNCCGLKGFADTVYELIDQVKVPIALHLDHCDDINYIIRAMHAGFTSVMYDGSTLPYEENLANTKKVVEIAHTLGVSVEAELGHVGFAATNDQHILDMYTKPEVAAEFCKQTHVDSCAVAVGSAHGYYIEEPKLDFTRLQEINKATSTPLVLHGGSGIPVEQLKQAFTMGINKFNVGTEFFGLYYTSIQEYVKEKGLEGGACANMLNMPMFVQDKLMNYLRKKMQISRI